MSNQAKAYILALVTVGLWSTIASAAKLSLRYLQPEELLLYASITSSIVLFGIIAKQKKLTLLTQISKMDIFKGVRYGFLNPFCYYLVLFKAYDLLPAQQAQIINYTWAIMVSILAVPLLGQKIARSQAVAIVLSYLGVLVIATRGELAELHFVNPFGVCLALFSTLLWSIYWILNTKDQRDPVVGLFLNFICILPVVALYVFFTVGFRRLPVEGYAGAAYIGCFEMGIAFVCWLKAMKYTESTAKIANLIFIAPFGSLVCIYFLVGEEIYSSTYAGLALVVAGLVVQAVKRAE